MTIFSSNKVFFIKTLIFALLAVVFSLSGCLSPWQGDLAKIVISFDGANRVVDYNADDITTHKKLEHEVVLTNETETLNFNFKGNTTFEAYVAPGNWNVSVYSYLDDTIYASGSKDVILKSGKDNKETITMRQAYYSNVPGSTLAAKLNWLKDNAVDRGEYTITVNSNESVDPGNWLGYNGKKVTITMTGGSVSLKNVNKEEFMFNIDSSVTLILRNITLTGSNNNKSPLVCVNGTLKMYAGAIATGNTRTGGSDTGGSGVIVSEGGYFLLDGGTISNNSSSNGGGGVNIWRGTFEMKNGSITNNKTTFGGGGVSIGENGIFNMSGGTISGNIATDYEGYSRGGGVYVQYKGTFNMSGGTISGISPTSETITYSASEGGGVSVEGNFILSGNGKIDGNYAWYGGGVYVNGPKGNFIMNGGTIFNNTVSGYENGSDGGGVCVNYYEGNGTFTMNAGTISGNNSVKGGGVSVHGGCYFTMTDGTITNNTASDIIDQDSGVGGGVYISNWDPGPGTFIKSGGTITGYDSKTNTGNVVRNSSNGVKNNTGHAVYASSDSANPAKRRENTAGVNNPIDTTKNGPSGGWE
jgi:hypothetical protein